MEIKDITDALKGQFDEMKKTNEDVLANELKGLGVAELKEKAEAVDAKLDASEAKFEEEKAKVVALEAKTEAYEKSIEELKMAFERDGEGVDAKEQIDLHAKAVDLFLRKGEEKMSADEHKALSTDSDEDGGFRLASGTTANIVTYMYETSPMRQHADVMTISGVDLTLTLDNDELDAGWVGEKSDRTETSTPKIQTKRITPYEIYAEPRATQKQLDDADHNVEKWLSGKVGDQFMRKENTAFVNGTGVEQPRGFMTYPAGTITPSSSQEKIEQISSGDANLIQSDALLEMEGALKSEYIAGAKYFLKRTSVTAVRKLKDGQGNYLWAPGFDGKVGNTINGYGYARFDDMPAEGADALAVAFGNMKLTYQIVDRIGIRTQRDPYTAKPFVKFYTTKRVGGDVKNFESMKLMKIEA